eukprot:gene8041-16479_t
MWNNLIEDEAKLRAAKQAAEDELIRAEGMNKFLLQENQKMRSDLEILEYTKTSNTLKLSEAEKAKQALTKELQKSRDELKYELMARDGMVRKTNTFEFENLGLKDEKKNLLDSQKLSHQRIKDLESALNDERVKRLRDMHEIDILRRQNANLSQKETAAEEDARNAHISVLQKLERTEVILSQNESQQMILNAQSEEMSNLMAEVTSLTEDRQRLHSELQSLQRAMADKIRHNDQLQEEVWRLRKEIVMSSTGQSQLSRAYNPLASQVQAAVTEDIDRRRDRGRDMSQNGFSNSFLEGSTLATPAPTSVLSLVYTNQSRRREGGLGLGGTTATTMMGELDEGNDYYSRSPFNSMLLGNRMGVSATDMGVTRLAELSVTEEQLESALSPSHRKQKLGRIKSPPTEMAVTRRLVGSSSSTGFSRDSGRSPYDEFDGSQSHDGGRQRRKTKNGHGNAAAVKALQELSYRPKTSFVGTGLGLRKESSAGYASQGSAKDIVRRVLAEKGMSH